MDINFQKRLENADNLADIFEVVKNAVMEGIGDSRGGLMLGLADLGNHPNGFFGAFFTVGTNIIVMNRTPLQRIKETQPELYKPYAFHILLHEYLHSLGYIDEKRTRNLVYWVASEIFGDDHVVTQMAIDMSKFFPNLTYPATDYLPEDIEQLELEMIRDFDRSSINYIR